MNEHTFLLRQVHPNFLPGNELSSQAFFPFPKDNGKLSVYDGDQITPEESFRHYTSEQKLISAGVWSVQGREVTDTGLSYQSDPLPDSPAHAVIDFGVHDGNEYRKLAKKLKAFALARGPLHKP
jgi:hypothetical protein